MKTIKLNSVLAIVFATSLSIASYGQENHKMMKMNHENGKEMEMNHKKDAGMMQQKGEMAKFSDANLNKAYMHYMMINNALTKANTSKVKMVSKMLITILKNYGKASDAATVANSLAEAKDIAAQRIVFADLTIAMEPLFKDNIVKGAVYKNFCPMANGKGAFWFSETNTILNPYLGDAMPTCGSLKETIKSM
jgi:hypothetical protein